MNDRSRWLMPLLLGLQTAFVGSTFNTWGPCVLLFAVAGIASWFRRQRQQGEQNREPISPSMRWIGNTVLYLVITILVSGWRLGDYAGESINPMAFGFDAVAHIAIASGLILWIRHPRTGHAAMLGLGLLVVMLCIAAGGASHSMASQIAVALVTTIGYLFASDFILGARQRDRAAGRTDRPQEQASGAGRIGILFSLITLSVILMSAGAIAQVTGYFLPNLQNTLHSQLSSTLDSLPDQTRIGSSRYVRGSRIGSIRRHMLGNPASVALTAYASTTPGYLRGTVFDYYTDGRWRAISNDRLPHSMVSEQIDAREIRRSGQGFMRLQGRSSRSLSRFFVHEPDDDRTATVEIHNEPLKGQLVFTPLASRWVEADARYLSVSHHDIVEEGVNVSNPYICGVATVPKPEVMEPQRRSLMLAVPPGIRQQVGSLSRQLCGSSVSAPSKANAISDYLRKNFSYSLTVDIPRAPGDPILQFLDLKHDAHCEYFATATCLLLRGAGVPARYVTGYIADEFSEEEQYWLARNRDAHAWVEAYDGQTGRWFPVESTPGRTYKSLLLTNENSGLFTGIDNQDTDDDGAEDSLLGYVWGWITSMRATDPLYIIFRFGLIPLFCVLAFLLWRSFRSGYDQTASVDDIKSKQMLQRIDRKVKRLSLQRRPEETLHQFAARIELTLDQDVITKPHQLDFLKQAADWYRQFASARYQGQMPVPFRQAA